MTVARTPSGLPSVALKNTSRLVWARRQISERSLRLKRKYLRKMIGIEKTYCRWVCSRGGDHRTGRLYWRGMKGGTNGPGRRRQAGTRGGSQGSAPGRSRERGRRIRDSRAPPQSTSNRQDMYLLLQGVHPPEEQPFPAIDTDRVAAADNVAADLATLLRLVHLQILTPHHAGLVQP